MTTQMSLPAMDELADTGIRRLHWTRAEVARALESDTTVRYDQTTKAQIYARAGVEEYWVLILKTRTLEIRRDPISLPELPGGYGYRSLTLYRESDTVTPMHAPNAILRIADLLPRSKETKTP